MRLCFHLLLLLSWEGKKSIHRKKKLWFNRFYFWIRRKLLPCHMQVAGLAIGCVFVVCVLFFSAFQVCKWMRRSARQKEYEILIQETLPSLGFPAQFARTEFSPVPASSISPATPMLERHIPCKFSRICMTGEAARIWILNVKSNVFSLIKEVTSKWFPWYFNDIRWKYSFSVQMEQRHWRKISRWIEIEVAS